MTENLAIDAFVLLLCIVGVFVVDVAWRSRTVARPRRSNIRRGPVPGYSIVEPEAFRRNEIDRIVPALRDAWSVARVETFNAGPRRRIVLGVSVRTDLGIDALESLARALQHASGAHVGAVEIVAPSAVETPWAVASPDGLGWSGHENDVIVTRSADGQVVEIRGAVATLGPIPATGWYVPPLDVAAQPASRP